MQTYPKTLGNGKHFFYVHILILFNPDALSCVIEYFIQLDITQYSLSQIHNSRNCYNAHETVLDLVCRLLLEKKKKKITKEKIYLQHHYKTLEKSTPTRDSEACDADDTQHMRCYIEH